MIFKLDTEIVPSAYFLNGVFAHGDLQNFLGYDCICTDSEMIKTISRNIRLGEQKPGIYTEIAVNEKGEHRYCRLYLWEATNASLYMRGFAVDINDAESIKYAEEKFRERAQII